MLPLKKSLVAKSKALEAALAAYKRALDYQVAEVTTAATFEMAELYRTLAQGRHGLGAAEESLQGRARTVRLAARGAGVSVRGAGDQPHEINAAHARDGVYDEWVKKSYGALAELKPARYAKTELSQDVVTTFK